MSCGDDNAPVERNELGEGETSSVPGGRSITSISRALLEEEADEAEDQSTSKSSCWIAFWTLRPRQTIGDPGGTRNPMDMTGRPCAVSGLRAPDGATSALKKSSSSSAPSFPFPFPLSFLPNNPRRVSKLGPKTSRSKSPTLGLPFLNAKGNAMFVAKVDLPTPPWPDEAEMRCLMCGIARFFEWNVFGGEEGGEWGAGGFLEASLLCWLFSLIEERKRRTFIGRRCDKEDAMPQVRADVVP